jgi:hypothetical protein
MLWIPIFAAGVINGIGHAFGYRNFECKDASKNILPWAFFIGGEELHNNHHTYPNSAKLSVKPWEFDIGWFWIRLFSFLGLAKARHIAPTARKNRSKQELDDDSLMAIIHNRFYILSQYHKHVMLPAIKEQKAMMREHEKALFRKARKLLVRDENLVKQTEQQRIQAMLERNPRIRMIYEKSLELQAIWKNNPGSRFQEKLQHLGEWCQQAEQSGIASLEAFAMNLKQYSLAKA